MIDIRRWNGDLYQIKVGPKQHVFVVHEHVLNQCPVFACMMSGGSFAESISKEIKFPEDDPDTFGRILEHLYGNHAAAFNFDEVEEEEESEILSDMYQVAEKYQLPLIQKDIMGKLDQNPLWKDDRVSFFQIARRMCRQTADSDVIFHSVFEKRAATHMKMLSGHEVDLLADLVDSGGCFAKKILQIQAELYRKSRFTIKRLEDEWKELEQIKDETEVEWENAMKMHQIWHPQCDCCFVDHDDDSVGLLEG